MIHENIDFVKVFCGKFFKDVVKYGRSITGRFFREEGYKSMNYRYIGVFTAFSGRFTIIDPAIHPLVKCFDPNDELPPMTRELVDNMYKGHYVAYHVVGDDGTLVRLFIMHEGLDPNFVASQEPADYAIAAITMSNTAVIVDEAAAFDGTKTKYLLYSDAYYDAKAVLDNLPNMPYSEDIKDRLEELAHQSLLDGVPVLGYDIFTCTEGAQNPVWPGFCALPSTHWGMDCCVRVHDDYRRGDTIWGGVVSTTDRAGLMAYQVYRDNYGKGYAICLDLFCEAIDTYYAAMVESETESFINPLSRLSSPAGITPGNLSGNGEIRKGCTPMGVDAFYGTSVFTGLDISDNPISDSEPVLSGFMRDNERLFAQYYGCNEDVDNEHNDSSEDCADTITYEEVLKRKIQKNTATAKEIDEYFIAMARQDDEYFGERLDDEYLSSIIYGRNDYLGVVRTLDDVSLDEFFLCAKKCYPEVKKYLACRQKSTKPIE